MVREILAAAWRLDRALKRRLGRPYAGLLSAGLCIEIVRHTVEIVHKAGEAGAAGEIVRLVAMVLFESALLLNQLAELSERFGGGEEELPGR